MFYSCRPIYIFCSLDFKSLFEHFLSVSLHALEPVVDTEPTVILQKGTHGELPCRVGIPAAVVFWYKGPTFWTSQLIIILSVQTEEKGGDGYSSRQYDVTKNFSLVINKVNIEDNDKFFCEISELDTGHNFHNSTSVVVLGKQRRNHTMKTKRTISMSGYFAESYICTCMTLGPKFGKHPDFGFC